MKTIPRYAIESINYNQLINESRLSPHYEKIAPADSFHAANRGEAGAVDIPIPTLDTPSVPPAESGHRLYHRPPVQHHLASCGLHLRQLRDPAPHHQVIMMMMMMMMSMMMMMITGGT